MLKAHLSFAGYETKARTLGVWGQEPRQAAVLSLFTVRFGLPLHFMSWTVAPATFSCLPQCLVSGEIAHTQKKFQERDTGEKGNAFCSPQD